MEKLKIGDSVYLMQNQRFGTGVIYSIQTVERLTNTRAVLSSGIQLINEPKNTRYEGDVVFFEQYGDRWNRWKYTTPEIIDAARIEDQKRKASSWFYSRKFTDEEKLLIYEFFVENGKLDANNNQ